MKVEPENVAGELVEEHRFIHSVEHQVNWSHVLFGLVVLMALLRLGPVVAELGDDEN